MKGRHALEIFLFEQVLPFVLPDVTCRLIGSVITGGCLIVGVPGGSWLVCKCFDSCHTVLDGFQRGDVVVVGGDVYGC